MPLLCIAFGLIAYYPVFNAGFVNWDDEDYVVKNPDITSFANLGEIVTRPVQGNHHPLTMLTLAANYAISGQNAGSYHVVNLLLHLLNILLVFFLVKRLTGDKPWLAFVVAIFFAVHPLHVESVAWVSERKDVLYSFFFLAGLLVYLRYLETGKPVHYISVLGLFVLSLLSKSAAVVFPVVLLAVDFLYGRLRSPKTWIEKIPLLILSLAMGLLTLHAQKLQGAVLQADQFPPYFRIFFGFYGMMMYLVKAIWPLHLGAFYPFPPVNEPLPTVYYVSVLAGMGLFAAFILTYRKNKTIAFAILFYLINLALVLQFMPVGSAVIADRYAYLPLIGVFLVPGFYFQKWVDKNKGKVPLTGIAVLAVLTVILTVLTVRQSATWKDSASLWDQVIRVAPGSQAYTMRGLIFKEENDNERALEMFDKAIRMNRIEKLGLVNRGIIYSGRKQFDKSIADYSACLAMDSNFLLALENRGADYVSLGKYDLALTDLNKVIRLNPKSEYAYKNRGILYQSTDRNAQAIEDFYMHIEINPSGSADILNAIAVSYIRLKDYQRALDVLSQAIKAEEKGMFYMNRAIAYRRLERKQEALTDALKARSLGYPVDQNFINSLK